MTERRATPAADAPTAGPQAGVKAFPHLCVRGTPAERGRQYGEALRERIARTFDFYLSSLFSASPLPATALRARADHIAALVQRLAPAAAEQITGIAAGAGLAPWQVFLLNGRTEILNAKVPECTALYFAATRVLAQNWDWVAPLEDLAVVVTHERQDGGRHVTFVEPGMIGKIGMNSDGLGVCLNILFAPHDLSGLPIHVLNGVLLEQPDLAAARRVMDAAGLGKASHVLVGDAEGGCLAMEFMGEERFEIAPEDGVLLHTNHCLAHGAAGRTAELANSCARYDLTAARLARAERRDLATAKALLLEQSGGGDDVNRNYRPLAGVLGDQPVGTCATLIMDLARRELHVKRGPGADDTFTRYSAA
jgi:isopenicillin-N N-acyltransferase-like protein